MVVSPFQAHTAQINLIKQSPYNSALIVSCSHDFTVKIWNLNLNWTLIRNYTNHTNSVFSFDFIDEDTIVSSQSYGIKIWSIGTGVTLKNIEDYALNIKMLSNGFYLAVLGFNSWGYPNVYIYNINDGSKVKYFACFYGPSKDFVSLDNYLVASTDDKVINIWDYRSVANGIYNGTLIGHTSTVYGLKLVSKDVLASASWDSTIKLWNLTSFTLIRTLSNHTNYIYWSLDFLNDETQTLVSGSLDKTIKLWNWTTGQLLKTKFTNLPIISLAVVN